MNPTAQLAKLLRDVHFGGNWAGVNVRDTLAGLDWRRATQRVEPFHSIATLVFHMNYYVEATIGVLQGEGLNAQDALSFDTPRITSEPDWLRLLQKTWDDAEQLAALIEQLPPDRLAETFVDEKYGTYHRCLHGPIEHCHYHLGQIAMLVKLVERDPSLR